MTTPTHGAPELPELPEPYWDAVTRSFTADQMREYARAAIQQAAGAVPEGLIACLRGGAQCDEDGTNIIMNREACCAAADILERLAPLGREAGKEGSSDHLAECAGGKCNCDHHREHCSVCQPQLWQQVNPLNPAKAESSRVPLTDSVIYDIAEDFKSERKFGGETYDEFDHYEFARAIEAAHGINPGSVPREDGNG